MNEDKQEKTKQPLEKLLNPAVLRGNLIAASLYITAYELLKSTAIDRIRGFFTNYNRQCEPFLDEQYKTDVLALDKSPFYASLLWFKRVGAIDEADLTLVDHIRQHRNALAHELFKFIIDPDAEIDAVLLFSTYVILSKIEKWWIREIEVAITGDDPHPGHPSDDDIDSGTLMAIRLMIQVASGDETNHLKQLYDKQILKYRSGEAK